MCRGAQLQAGEMLQEIGFALDSLLEETGFEPSVPRRGRGIVFVSILIRADFSRARPPRV
jgi:hypothetical protein